MANKPMTNAEIREHMVGGPIAVLPEGEAKLLLQIMASAGLVTINRCDLERLLNESDAYQEAANYNPNHDG